MSVDALIAQDPSSLDKDQLFAVGEHFDNVKKDLEKAAQYYELASNKNHATATRYAGFVYRQLASSSSAKPSYATKAVEFYKKAASEPFSDARAMAALGYFYEKGLKTDGSNVVSSSSSSSSAASSSAGVTVAPDTKEAIRWYKAAVATNKDDGTAALNLALLYEKGQLTGSTLPAVEDKKAAFELFKSIADKPDCKNAAALINAGLYYEKGEKEGVVAKDMKTALNSYYMRAAKLGDATAMAIVGCCYETGQGTAVDYEVAADFYVRGAMAGNSHAREGLRRLRDAGKI